jgi:hypothetical protein
MTIYILFKYHQDNVIEVMLKKTSFLKKLLKYIKKNMVYFKALLIWITSS